MVLSVSVIYLCCGHVADWELWVSTAAQHRKGVSCCIILTWEKIQIQSTVSTECIWLLKYWKVEKLCQTMVSWVPFVDVSKIRVSTLKELTLGEDRDNKHKKSDFRYWLVLCRICNDMLDNNWPWLGGDIWVETWILRSELWEDLREENSKQNKCKALEK